ncbi:YetF domain-containing protein [Lacticaseibacillus zhaodongensis]|uniref:YetF domain-containing protein n=1 Tax=Lacticaseibacillus zhaodongensis TaxID=2668065 RepID=UPI0012D33C1A|nr:YetF domain-containing protein [Lacticaseibacillus zhaodongensis]
MALNWNYYLGIVWKMLTVITLLIIYTRLSGSRRLAPVTVFDSISNLVVGAIAGTTLLNQNVRPIDLGMFMTIWILLLVAIRFLRRRYPKVRVLLDGSPIELIVDGKMQPRAFKRAGLSPTSLQTMLRSQGVPGPHAVDDAIFERNGELSVNLSSGTEFSVILVDRGRIKHEALERADRDAAWLTERLAAAGKPQLSQIFCAEWDGERLWLTAFDGQQHQA